MKKRKLLNEQVSLDEINEARKHTLSVFSEEFACSRSRLLIGILHEKFVRVVKFHGKHFQTMGFSCGGLFYLHPEETIYLAERNQLQVWHENLPLSIQQLYDALLDHNTYLNYIVYSKLMHLNFVLRKRPISKPNLVYSGGYNQKAIIPESINVRFRCGFGEFGVSWFKNSTLSLNSLSKTSNNIITDFETTANFKESVDDERQQKCFIFDVYSCGSKTLNFSKRLPPHPDYVVLIATPLDTYPQIYAGDLIDAGLDKNTSVILSVVDGCDTFFHILNEFKIPTINFEKND